jgi:hypothetical protein
LKSVDELNTLKAKTVVVGYFGPENHNYETFVRVSSEFDDITFVHNFEDSLKGSLQANTVSLFKSFDESQNNFDGELTADALKAFIETHSMKTLMEFDEKAAEAIF